MTVVTCKLMGGLGNQLFQIFAVINYALKYGKEFCFDTSQKTLNIGKSRETYWDTFLSALKPHNITGDIKTVFFEEDFKYHPIPDTPDSICLFGYFQSPKYFIDHYDDICAYLGINSGSMVDTADVALHFRIDDYAKLNSVHPVLPVNYYINALKYIISKDPNVRNVTIIYQPCDLDKVMDRVRQLKDEFPTLNFNMVSAGLKDWEQLMFMSRHKHKIIANSTFSWWGAYFNQSSGMVCYPDIWFGPKSDADTSDLFPNDWHRICF